MTTTGEKGERTSWSKQLNISVRRNNDHLLVNCEFCKQIIATLDTRVLPHIELEDIVLGALKVHLHIMG
jgi:hypothetical protein